MKKRILVSLIVVALLIALSSYAFAATQTVLIVPNITFSGTEATCTANISGDMYRHHLCHHDFETRNNCHR